MLVVTDELLGQQNVCPRSDFVNISLASGAKELRVRLGFGAKELRVRLSFGAKELESDSALGNA